MKTAVSFLFEEGNSLQVLGTVWADILASRQSFALHPVSFATASLLLLGGCFPELLPGRAVNTWRPESCCCCGFVGAIQADNCLDWWKRVAAWGLLWVKFYLMQLFCFFLSTVLYCSDLFSKQGLKIKRHFFVTGLRRNVACMSQIGQDELVSL